MILTVCYIFVITFLLYTFVREKRKHDFLKSLPGPAFLPFIGSVCFYTSTKLSFAKLMLEFGTKYGNRFRMAIGKQLIIVFSDPKDIAVILNGVLDKSEFYDYLKPWLGKGLLTNDVPAWKVDRKFLNPAFQYKPLEGHLIIFDEYINNSINEITKIKENREIDVFPIISTFTMNSILDIATGVKLDKTKTHNIEYVSKVKELLEIMNVRCTNVFMQINFLFELSEYGKRNRQALKVTDSFIRNIIKNRKEALKEYPLIQSKEDDEDFGIKKKMSFLDYMLMPGERVFSDKEMVDHLQTIIFGGHDTTTAGLSFTLYNLSKYPEIQQKAYNEQVEIFGHDKSRSATNSDLQSMNYLELVIKETMRIYIIAPAISRTNDKDMMINDLNVPKNSILIINAIKMFQDPELFPDPNKFIPERFTAEECAKRHPYAFLPFSAGPRNCIGYKYGMMQIKCAASKMLRNFELSFSGKDLVITGDIVAKPETGVQIVFKDR